MKMEFAPTTVNLEAKPLVRPDPARQSDNLAIVGIDPGGVTGWSTLVFPKKVGRKSIFSHPIEVLLENRVEWMHGQVDCHDEDAGFYIMSKSLFNSGQDEAFVVEAFQLRTLAADLSPVRITALIEHQLWRQGRKVHYKQMPAMAKRLDNDRLKLMKVYTSEDGLQHARDADRHILMAIRRCMEPGAKGKKMQAQLWPNIYG